MLETGNFLQGKNGVQNKGKTNGSNSWSNQTDSFMDILASTKKNTQETTAKKESAPEQNDKVSSKDTPKKEPSETKNETDNKDVKQTEQVKPVQEKPAEENAAVDPAASSMLAMLAANIVVPQINPEVTNTQNEEAASIVAETIVVAEEGTQQGELPVENLVQQNKTVSNVPEQGMVQEDAGQEVMAEQTKKDEEGQIKMPVAGVEKKEAEQPIVVKSLSESGQAQTEEKNEQPKTMVAPGQMVAPNVEQTDSAAIKFNDSSSLLQRQVTQQVTDQIMSNIQDKQQQFTMSLHPDRLGQVAVKMFFEGGKVMVHVETHSQLAQHLLTAGASEIKAMIENTGVQVDGVSIEQYMDQRQQDPRDSRNQAQHDKHSSAHKVSEGENEVIDEINAEQIPVTNGLNYSI